MEIHINDLILRSFVPKDINGIHLLANDPRITKYLSYIDFPDRQHLEKWVSERITETDQSPRRSINLIIEHDPSREFVGWIGIGVSDHKDKGDLDFAYAILPQWQGRGIATLALETIIDLAWAKLPGKVIYGECDKDNVASRKVMEHAGMSFVTEYQDGKDITVRYSIAK